MEEMDCQVLQAIKVRTACGKGQCKGDGYVRDRRCREV